MTCQAYFGRKLLWMLQAEYSYCVVPACPHAHLTPVDRGDSESSVPVVQISNPSLQAQAVTRGVRLCHKFASYCGAVPKQPLDMQGSCQKT